MPFWAGRQNFNVGNGSVTCTSIVWTAQHQPHGGSFGIVQTSRPWQAPLSQSRDSLHLLPKTSITVRRSEKDPNCCWQGAGAELCLVGFRAPPAPSLEQVLHPHGDACWEWCFTCLCAPWVQGKGSLLSLIIKADLQDSLCRAAQNSQKCKANLFCFFCLCVMPGSGHLNCGDLEAPPQGPQPPCCFIKK